jgi:hypothetical protein
VNRESLLELAQAAETLHCRPSSLLDLTGAPALRVDLACANALWKWRSGEEEPQLIEW